MRALLVLASCACAAAWTVDLTARRQQLFPPPGPDPAAESKVKEGEIFYNNYYGNSPYDSANTEYIGNAVRSHPEWFRESGSEDEEDQPLYEGQPYAGEYEYQTYMEKKVDEVVRNGTRYLEGLQRAVELYIVTLENCSDVSYNDLPARYASCARATERGEQVRRVAQLAAHAAAKLRDAGPPGSEYDRHANKIARRALLLRVAMYLERLAALTGFEPRAAPRDPATTTTAAPPPPTPPPTPAPERARLVACWAGAAGAAQAQRCVPLSQRIQNMLNITELEGIPEVPSTSEPSSVSVLPPQSVRARRSLPLPPTHPPASLLGDVIKYYAKYRAWTNVNPDGTDAPAQHEFIDTNHVIAKRSTDSKTLRLNDITARLLRTAQTSKASTRRVVHNSIQDGARKIQDGGRKIHNGRRRTRSIPPRIPEDPMQDISYVVKTRPGVSVRLDAAQAARVRAGLERHLRTGSVESLRRFGANVVV